MTENKAHKLTSESTPREYLDEGLSLVRRTLDNLYQAGLLVGYAAIVEPDQDVMPECGAMIVSCCTGHAVQNLHPNITENSGDPELKRAAHVTAIRELLNAFRQVVPDMPEAGPEERAQDAEDENREQDAEAAYDVLREVTGLPLSSFPGACRLPGTYDDEGYRNDGTGQYL